jgi:hypothetical protein
VGHGQPGAIDPAKVPELVARGATVVREEYDEGVLDHVVMLDPEGNEFCVA